MALKSYITNEGLRVMSALASGGTLTVTKAAVGDGVTATDTEAKALEDLKSYIQDIDVMNYRISEGWHIVTAGISNEDLSESLNIHEIGLFCDDPSDPGSDVMFYYATFGSNSDWVAPASVAQYVRTYDLCFNIGLVDAVEIVASPEALVTEEEFSQRMGADALLTNIKTVDGSGSGLDADMLDGKHAAEFSMSDHGHTLGDLSGTLGVDKGGTGATSASAARTALGAAAASHNHSPSDISSAVPVNKGGTGATSVAGARNALGLGNTSGAVPIANGGTGATNAASARENLGAAASGHSHTLDNLSGTLSVEKGGTGATSAAAARTALGAASATHSHAPSELTSNVPINKGGTGASTAADALSNLGIVYSATEPTVINGGIWLKPI